MNRLLLAACALLLCAAAATAQVTSELKSVPAAGNYQGSPLGTRCWTGVAGVTRCDDSTVPRLVPGTPVIGYDTLTTALTPVPFSTPIPTVVPTSPTPTYLPITRCSIQAAESNTDNIYCSSDPTVTTEAGANPGWGLVAGQSRDGLPALQDGTCHYYCVSDTSGMHFHTEQVQ